jgi:hypothetical protein
MYLIDLTYHITVPGHGDILFCVSFVVYSVHPLGLGQFSVPGTLLDRIIL